MQTPRTFLLVLVGSCLLQVSLAADESPNELGVRSSLETVQRIQAFTAKNDVEDPHNACSLLGATASNSRGLPQFREPLVKNFLDLIKVIENASDPKFDPNDRPYMNIIPAGGCSTSRGGGIVY